MQTTASSLSQDIKRGLNQIGGQYALSAPVAILSYVWATLISVGYDRNRFGTPIAGWFIASTIAHIAIVWLALPFRLTVLPVKPRESKPGVTLAVYALLGVARSSIVGALTVQFGLAPTQEFGFRQVAGLFSITSGLAITAITVTAVAERRNTLLVLRQERAQLNAIKIEAEDLFEEKRKEVLQIIDESIKPSLEEINKALQSTPEANAAMTEQTTQLISKLIDQRLRPISDALHEPAAFLSGNRDWSKVRTPYVRRTSKIAVNKLFSPLLVTFLMAALTLSGTIYYAGFAAVLIATTVYLPFFAILYVTKRLIPDTWILNLWIALPVTLVVHIIAGTPSISMLIWLERYYPGFNDQIYTAALGFAVGSIAIAVMRALEIERRNFETDLKAANEEAAAILSNLNQRIWVTRKNAAQLLHGSVQASLTAANVRLHQGNLTKTDLDKVREDITRAISALSIKNTYELDIEDAIEDLIDLWDGVCDIETSISPQVIEFINQDATSVQCVNEFLKECINNAIKHGRATQIDIEIKPAGTTAVEVAVANDGKQTAQNQSGLGTRILDEITLTWKREQSASQTTVTGVIAVFAGQNAN